MENQVSIKKNIVWNSIGTFVMFFCQWLMMVLVVRLSGYADSGVLSLSISCGNVFLIIAAFGVKTYQVSDIKGVYTAADYYAVKIITIALTVIVGVIWTLVSGYSATEKISIVLYMFYVLVYSYSDALYGELQKKWRLDVAGKSLCIRNIAALIIFCAILWFTKNIIIAIALMLVISLTVLLAFDLPQTKKVADILPSFKNKNSWILLKECIPFAIYSVLHTLILTVPKLAVRGYLGVDTLGIYSAVLAPVTVLQVVATFVINPLSTILATHLNDKKIKDLVKVMVKCILMLVGFLVAGILISIFIGKWGLSILYGKDITQYSYLLIPMVILSIMTALTILLSNLGIVLRDKIGPNISGVVGLVATIVACIGLIPVYSMQGANYAAIIGLAVQDIILIVFIVLKLKKQNNKIEGEVE